MNTDQLITAINNLDHSSGKTEGDLVTEWKTFLYGTYAPHLTARQLSNCFNMAWKNGHSSGYREVEYIFVELCELFD